MTQELMTIDEASKRLRTKVGTMQWWRTMGRGPVYVKVGRHVFYRTRDLDDFVAAGVCEPAEG